MSWIEVLPFIGGLIAAIAGGALIADAALSDETVAAERRRAPRAERNRVGQGCLGGSLVFTALILLGGGGSTFAVASTFVGIALLAAGVFLNWRYLLGLINGPAERLRAATGSDSSGQPDDYGGRKTPAYGWPVTSED